MGEGAEGKGTDRRGKGGVKEGTEGGEGVVERTREKRPSQGRQAQMYLVKAGGLSLSLSGKAAATGPGRYRTPATAEQVSSSWAGQLQLGRSAPAGQVSSSWAGQLQPRSL